MIPLGLLLVVAVVFVAMGGFGLCLFCRSFTNEYEHGQYEGGFRYVADQEHDAAGQPLTGWRLVLSRAAEMAFFPVCYPINKLLGREATPPQKDKS